MKFLLPKWRLFACLVFVLQVFGLKDARSEPLVEMLLQSTYIIDIKQGTKLSEKADALARGGFELAGGEYVSFDRWYKAKWTEMRFDYMTQFSPNVGLLWGVSTGEFGPKYFIEPGVKIGIILQFAPTPTSSLSFSVTEILGAFFREKPCMADYGDIAGVQQVNCRLAATTLAPAETLQYLVKARPPDHGLFKASFRISF